MTRPATVHRYGGRTVWQHSRAWNGLALDVARWRVSGDDGVTRPRDHLVFVTLDGSIGRTVARVEDGQGYSGADLRPARLAAVAGVGPHRIGRGFKAATGTTPHRYVLERRIERAAELLRTRGDLSIADVAHLVGRCRRATRAAACRTS